MLKGRAIADPPVPIVELAEDSGVVVVEGEIIGVNEPKELKGGETVLVTFSVGDDTSTIYCKAFYNYRMPVISTLYRYSGVNHTIIFPTAWLTGRSR